ncbi:hypothetical protein [Streptomyces regalis]|uniref:hypothetical protein n=1 Tax=Streptomyces regalis TaxID=68262 RepID=UPI000AC6A915|nr:hypothetical protein [Streptomyces regalis]
MKTTALAKPGVKMTIRMYSVDRYGSVTAERGTVSILHGFEPLRAMSVNPPCACPRCRAGRAVTR